MFQWHLIPVSKLFAFEYLHLTFIAAPSKGRCIYSSLETHPIKSHIWSLTTIQLIFATQHISRSQFKSALSAMDNNALYSHFYCLTFLQTSSTGICTINHPIKQVCILGPIAFEAPSSITCQTNQHSLQFQ